MIVNLNATTLSQARLAIAQATRNHLFDRNVHLIEFGFPEHRGRLYTDELAIRIHVRKKMSGVALEAAVEAGATSPIPEAYGEFQTDVPQSSFRLHQGWWWPKKPATRSDARTRRQAPLLGGISISNAYQLTAGTLGGVVTDRQSGERMLLSNWHVLAGRWTARPGQRIYQPGRLDGGRSADSIASLVRNAMDSHLDAAVARIAGERQLINDQYDLGSVSGVVRPELGMRLVKSGRRTAITYGQVTAIEGIAKMRYDSLDRVIEHVLTIEPENGFGLVSGPGDSGAMWLEEDTLRAVGLHFAGSDYPERALAMELQPVLNALEVDIVTSVERAKVFIPARRVEREPA
jgi:hypothetical protein